MSWAVGLVLFLTVYFDGVPVRCVADTGAAVTVLRQTDAARIGTLSPPLERVPLGQVGGTVLWATVHEVPNVGTGYLAWPRARVHVVPDEAVPAGCLLGANLLAQQDIVIRWGQGQVYPVVSIAAAAP